MIQFILGGARSGKSRLAEQIAQQLGKTVIYVATAQAGDAEMQARIQHHRQQRGFLAPMQAAGRGEHAGRLARQRARQPLGDGAVEEIVLRVFRLLDEPRKIERLTIDDHRGGRRRRLHDDRGISPYGSKCKQR